jgi:hypothetical protein
MNTAATSTTSDLDHVSLAIRLAAVDGGSVTAEVYATDTRSGDSAELGTAMLLADADAAAALSTWGDCIDCWASDGLASWLLGLDATERASATAEIVDLVQRAYDRQVAS